MPVPTLWRTVQFFRRPCRTSDPIAHLWLLPSPSLVVGKARGWVFHFCAGSRAWAFSWRTNNWRGRGNDEVLLCYHIRLYCLIVVIIPPASYRGVAIPFGMALGWYFLVAGGFGHLLGLLAHLFSTTPAEMSSYLCLLGVFILFARRDFNPKFSAFFFSSSDDDMFDFAHDDDGGGSGGKGAGGIDGAPRRAVRRRRRRQQPRQASSITAESSSPEGGIHATRGERPAAAGGMGGMGGDGDGAERLPSRTAWWRAGTGAAARGRAKTPTTPR